MRVAQTKLERVEADIRQYVTDVEDRDFAERQLSSIRDFALGDDRACSARAALENCEQIKGYFPAGTPAAAFENIDELERDISAFQSAGKPALVRFFSHPLVLLALGAALVYFVFFSR